MAGFTSLRELGIAYAAAIVGGVLALGLLTVRPAAGPGGLVVHGEEGWHEVGMIGTPLSIPEEIRRAALAEGVDPALVAAIVQTESGFDPRARSAKGAVGLMQVLPETALLVGVPAHEEPEANLKAGCRYLRLLFEDFGGDVELVLAAYNAGPGAVYRFGGIPPYRETRNFIVRVAEAYRNLTGQPLEAARFGFWGP